MTAATPGWSQTQFAAMSATHGVIVLIGLAVCVACGVLAMREARRGSRAFADGFGGVVLGWNLLATIWWLLPANWEIGSSLPLHVCDLNNLLIPFALWTRRRVLLAVSMFWGLGLGTQAFVTPTVNASPAEMTYWLFWVGHLTIAAGCCVIAGTGYRPGWRDWRVVTVLSLGMVMALMAINGVLGTNYGYVGNHTPSTRTLIDFLGPWPWRVVWLFLIASVAHALVLVCYPTLPWLLAHAGGARADHREAR